MKCFFISLFLFLLTTFALTQTDPEFETYLANERKNLPVAGELLYNCANLGGYRFSGSRKIVDADTSLPFGKALQLTVRQAGANPWEPQLQTPVNSIPVASGDVLFYIFYIRVLETAAADGYGKAFVYVQRSSSPWTGLGSLSVAVPPEWQKYYVVAKAGERYAVGGMEATFHLGYFKQLIEVGGIIALNLGRGIDEKELPQNEIIYDGMDLNAPWRAEAAQRIEQYRKGDLTVMVKNENGLPIKNANIEIKMTQHAYQFGTFMSELALTNSTNAQKYKAEVLSLFNCATTPFYMGDGNWGWYGPGNSKTQYPALAQWLWDHEIPTKGHVLIWPSWTWMPPFFKNYENDPAGLRDAIDEHLETLVDIGEEKGLVQWDVVNEPHVNHDVMDICGDEIMVHWYKKVHEIDPNPRLILNEYNIIVGGGDAVFQDDFCRWIEILLNGKAPLGGIGMQCHFGENLTGIPRVLAILDRFAQYNLPIQVTEFDIDIIDEEIQAAYTRDFFTAIFSHPATDKIVMWGFWEGDQWKPNGAMIRTDWSYKPNYLVYKKLLFEDWWTEAVGLSSREGRYQTRGFLGEYDITAAFAGKTTSKSIALPKEGTTVEIQIPTTETSVEVNNNGSTQFDLKQNFPNPFNPVTRIRYDLPVASPVLLQIFDIDGRLVETLVDGFQSAGHHSIEWTKNDLPSGTYFYKLSVGNLAAVRKMLLIK